jgi:hypothetical protein
MRPSSFDDPKALMGKMAEILGEKRGVGAGHARENDGPIAGVTRSIRV